MKKIVLLVAALLLALSVTGCAHTTNAIREKMMKKSGIYEDANYQEYQQHSNNGELDENGYYCEESFDAAESETASVHVTFAENNNLNIRYYSDSLLTHPIDVEKCFLNPGDTLYAVVEISDNVFSSAYVFSEFRIYEYTLDGNRSISDTLVMKSEDNHFTLNIPASYQGTEIEIEPVGGYEPISLSLNDYYVDEDEEEQPLPGTWFVNNEEYTSDTIEICPMSSYIISYQYDSEKYFFVSSSPECYYNTDGKVIFNQFEADDEIENYSVELQKYLSVTLVSDTDRTVTVNDGATQTIAENGELVIPNLKYGDTVIIKTNHKWKSLEKSRELVLTDDKLDSGEYIYTLIVPERGGEFTFDPSSYSYEHGEILFKCFGSIVTTTQVLAKESRIYYEEASADSGWWLAGAPSKHYVTVGDEEETREALEAIHFTEKVEVTVELKQPDKGGYISYMIDGERIYKQSVTTSSGTVITMKYFPWEGWVINSDENSYQVTTSLNQSIAIEDAFVEDEDHKPELNLILEKSVGESMKFTVEASGGTLIEDVSYGGGWNVTKVFDKDSDSYNLISNDETVISDEKIGTDTPINISMSGKAIQSGTAVRMVITMTDRDGNQSTEIRYIDNFSDKINPIYIYPDDDNGRSTVWYKSIDITIGVVDVETFKPSEAAAHSEITVSVQSTNQVLESGDLIEASAKVIVAITPDSGYYVTGKNVTEDIYSEIMTFSEYQKDIETIIEKHPLQRYYSITLDASDDYATYSYKLDGKSVSGTIRAKAGQTLELTYEITDGSHSLTKSHGGVPLVGWGASTTKATGTVTITSSMDGKTVTKSTFGIETK